MKKDFEFLDWVIVFDNFGNILLFLKMAFRLAVQRDQTVRRVFGSTAR